MKGSMGISRYDELDKTGSDRTRFLLVPSPEFYSHGYLISKKHILKLGEKNRALDPNDAYRAIHSAYDEQKDQLELAASLI